MRTIKGFRSDKIFFETGDNEVHGPAPDTSQPAFRWPLVRGRDHHFVLALVLPLQTLIYTPICTGAPFFGMAIGAAMGALSAKFKDYSIDDDFVKNIRGNITEG